jgi:hypothetical protein
MRRDEAGTAVIRTDTRQAKESASVRRLPFQKVSLASDIRQTPSPSVDTPKKVRHISPRLPAGRLGGPPRDASKPLNARSQGGYGLAVELDCETCSEQADRDDDSELTLGADDDPFVAPERTIGDRDRGAGFDVWVRDERKAAFLKRAQSPELGVEERLVDHVDHTRDEVAPKGCVPVVVRASEEEVPPEERQVRDEVPPGAPDLLFALREVIRNTEGLEVPCERLLLPALDVRHPPGVSLDREVEEVLWKKVRFASEEGHISVTRVS